MFVLLAVRVSRVADHISRVSNLAVHSVLGLVLGLVLLNLGLHAIDLSLAIFLDRLFLR